VSGSTGHAWLWWAVPAGLAAAVGLWLIFLPWLVRATFWLMVWPRYALRVAGAENLPRSGPALVVANHLTWIDGFLAAAGAPRPGKVLVNAAFIDKPGLRWLARRAGVIPIALSGPRAMRVAIEAVGAALDRGEAVLIFPEGQLNRTGLLGPFRRGIEVILKDRPHVPVIPLGLDNLWGSYFSFSGGHFFHKRPAGLRRPVGLAFGPPIAAPVTAFAARQAVLESVVVARERNGIAVPWPETVLASTDLPRLEHPTLGLLAASVPDFDRGGVRQPGHRDGSVGLAVPGVALRVVDATGKALGPDDAGRLEARVAGRPGWVETGLRARLDRDGFVFLDGPPGAIDP